MKVEFKKAVRSAKREGAVLVMNGITDLGATDMEIAEHANFAIANEVRISFIDRDSASKLVKLLSL